MAHYRYPFKCLTCGVHWNVYSWDEAWVAKTKVIYCPECGDSEGWISLGSKQMGTEIFEEVPGQTDQMDHMLREIEEEGLKPIPTNGSKEEQE